MTNQQFFSALAAVTAATATLLGVLHVLLEPMQMHLPLSVSTLVIFVLLCIGLFVAGKKTARSTSKVAFNGLVSASVFGKMLLAIAILFVYQETNKPTNQWFVGLFLLVYVIYTVFEVWFMTKIAKEK